MISPILDLTLANAVATGFAAFALSVFITGKNGPFNIFERLRNLVGTPLKCFTCSAGFWCLLFICIIDFLIIAAHNTSPVISYVWSAWLLTKFFLSGSGVALSLTALAGRLNLDV